MSLLLLVLLAAPADQLGFGSSGQALGNATLAAPTGAAAAFYNPAWAAARPGVEALAGYTYTALRFTVNGIDQELAPARGVSLGLVVPATISSLGRFGLAAAVSMPDQRILLTRVIPTDRPRFLMYDNRLQCMSIDVALSHLRRFGELEVGLAAGASVLTGAAGDGTTFYLRQEASAAHADATVNVDLPVTFAPLVATFVRWRQLSVGLLFRGTLEFDLNVGTSAEINIGALRGDLQTAISGVDFYTPAKLGLGAAWDVGELTLYATVEYHRWHAAPPLTARWTTAVDLIGLPVDIPQGQPAAQRLRDIVVPRVGAEERLALGQARLALRVGAYVAPTPLTSDADAILLDADRFGAGLGLGLTLPDPLEVLVGPISLDAHLATETVRRRTFASRGSTDLRPDLQIAGYLLSGGAALTLRF
jgi:hypothetical protein